MYLHRVRIENWRALREAIELAELSQGVNVIYGPNETGKSTILDALCRGFFDRHKTSVMHSRQPWGAALGPRVEIEFEVVGQRWLISKQFVEEPFSELRRSQANAWERVAQGQTADEALIKLINGEHAARGLSSAAQWGLGQVLWSPQGKATEFEVGEQQQGRLREALRITLDSGQGSKVEELIDEWYSAIYTPQGRYKGGQNKAVVLDLAERLDTATQRVETLRQRLRDVEQLSHTLEAAEGEQEVFRKELRETHQELDRTRHGLTALQAEQRQYDRLVAEGERTRAEWEKRNRHVSAISDADTVVQDTAAEVSLEKDRAVSASEVVVASAGALRVAISERDARRHALRDAEDGLANVERLVRYLEIREELRDTRSRLDHAQRLATRIEKDQQDLAALRAPSQHQMKALRKLHLELREKKSQLDAASLSVSIEPTRALSVNAEIDRKPQPATTLSALTEFRAVSEMSLTFPKIGRVAIRAGDSNVAEVEAELEELRKKWNKSVIGLAVDDISELEGLAIRRTEAEVRIKQLGERREGEKPVDELAGEADALDNRLRILVAEDPSLAGCPDGLDEAKRLLNESKVVRTDAKLAAENSQERLDALQQAHQSALDAEASAKTKLAVVDGRLSDQRRHAAHLRVEDGLSDETRAKVLGEARLAMDAARQRLDGTPKPPLDDATSEIEQLDQTVRSLNTDLQELAAQIGTLSARLTSEGGEGLYSQLARAVEEQARLQDDLSRAKLDAEATKLLYETLQQKKRDVIEAVLQPIRHMVTSDMARVVGPRYDRIEFDERLVPVRVRPARRDTDATRDDLSYGTQEQLMLLVRLALGRLLSRSLGRQCVILDDPLVNADRSRQRAALRVLEDAAAETQVIVFTCHPTSYDGINAKRYDLKALVDGAAWKTSAPSNSSSPAEPVC